MPVARHRHGQLRKSTLFRLSLENQELFRFLERKTFEKKVVDQTEDSGVHPDAERQGEDGEKGERRRLEELADGEAEIDHGSGNFRIAIFNFRLGILLGAESKEGVDAGSAS